MKNSSNYEMDFDQLSDFTVFSILSEIYLLNFTFGIWLSEWETVLGAILLHLRKNTFIFEKYEEIAAERCTRGTCCSAFKLKDKVVHFEDLRVP